ncbi:hypothetical protein C8F04DRAFT_1187638 [Mycena alexandri]|uniref:Uncharacterized protein n=1 Tax=Mycena alexandri TaxID=1745969 RepID=A0AAD6SM19_9AGAR|nr:hypothetical protein C8F04DRAFT_1187638 [Mycena alexandri]
MSAVAKLKSEHLPSSTFENAVFGRQNCYFGAEICLHKAKGLRRDALEPTEEFSLVEDQPDATQGTIATHWSLGISAQDCQHRGHHSIAQEVVQYPLTFRFDGNVERVAGIAFHTEWLHPGHHSIAQDPVQSPLMFSFDGNVECVGSIVATIALPRVEYIAPSQLVGIMTPGASAVPGYMSLERVARTQSCGAQTGNCAKSYAAPSQFPRDGAPGIEQS